MSVNALFRSELKVANIGLSAFNQALKDSDAPSVQVDWKPPVDVDAGLVKRVETFRPVIERANAEVMKIILSGMPQLV